MHVAIEVGGDAVDRVAVDGEGLRGKPFARQERLQVDESVGGAGPEQRGVADALRAVADLEMPVGVRGDGDARAGREVDDAVGGAGPKERVLVEAVNDGADADLLIATGAAGFGVLEAGGMNVDGARGAAVPEEGVAGDVRVE